MTRYDKGSIKRIRKNRGLSLFEFGKPLGMRPQQVRGLENGVGYPNVRTLERIMEAYGVEPNNFFVKEHN